MYLESVHRFLYQVVPGTSEQCQRLLLRSARANDLNSIKKLVCVVLYCSILDIYCIAENTTPLYTLVCIIPLL